MSDGNPCSGSGCCQTSIPKGLKSLNYSLSSLHKYTNVSDFNLCGFAFLVDKNSFEISDWPLSRKPKYEKDAYTADIVIEWVVKNETCEQAKANRSAYACGTNANCTYPEIGQGYRCLCNEGFEGNPYLPEGCQGKMVIAFSYDLTITNNYAYAGYVVPRCLLSCSVFIKIICLFKAFYFTYN
jgi:hypothetical protein